MKENSLLCKRLSNLIRASLLVFLLVGVGQVVMAQTTTVTPMEASQLIAQELEDSGLNKQDDIVTDFQFTKVKFYYHLGLKMKDLADNVYSPTDPQAVIDAFNAISVEHENGYAAVFPDRLPDIQTVISEAQILLSIF